MALENALKYMDRIGAYGEGFAADYEIAKAEIKDAAETLATIREMANTYLKEAIDRNDVFYGVSVQKILNIVDSK